MAPRMEGHLFHIFEGEKKIDVKIESSVDTEWRNSLSFAFPAHGHRHHHEYLVSKSSLVVKCIFNHRGVSVRNISFVV